MSLIRKQNVFHAKPTHRTFRAALTLVIAVGPFAAAQTPLTSKPAADVIAANLHFDLPDSPGTLFTGSSSSADASSADPDSPDPGYADPNGAQTTPTGPRPKAAAHLKMIVNPGEVAQPMPVRDKVPGLGHAIELRVYRSSGGLHVDWWYDTRRLQQAKVEALAERFPAALTELIEEAMASSRAASESGGATEELGLVDLSAE